MFMLRRSSRRRKHLKTGFWRRVVESVRKVHSEMTIMPSPKFMNTICLPPPPPLGTEIGGHDSGNDDDDVFSGKRSSEGVEVLRVEPTWTSTSGICGYASAMSLRDLGNNDDDDECCSDVEEGDDMIDEKAEEFIMRFHQQMKMQNQVYTQRCKAQKGLF
ncbi:unnamed protein product [Cochlearia groenlandica]